MSVIYTTSNLILQANGSALGFVQSVDVEDFIDPKTNAKYTRIILLRLANNFDEIINDMRAGKFEFKLFNNETNCGYFANEAEVIGFKMRMAAKTEPSNFDFLTQTITIKTSSFVFVKDVRSEIFKNIEKNDIENLKKIIKDNQNICIIKEQKIC